jgi:hypothetical protein
MKRKAFAVRRYDANRKTSIYLFTIRNTEDETYEAFFRSTTAEQRKAEGYGRRSIRANIIPVEINFKQ